MQARLAEESEIALQGDQHPTSCQGPYHNAAEREPQLGDNLIEFGFQGALIALAATKQSLETVWILANAIFTYGNNSKNTEKEKKPNER
ncbi:hypothetical protein BG003_002729 [Podila horticola]|nr:hypothetical protein BG003_002729 [Podila horticola]